MHAFVDETKQDGLLLATAIGTPATFEICRKGIRALILPGQDRIHFTKESDQRRRLICSRIADMGRSGIRIRAYDMRHIKDQRLARAAGLDAIVRDLAAIGAHRMVVEQDDSLLAADLRILHGARRAHAATALNYAHARAAAEPLLCIPDAVAWCLATRKPGWRARIAPIVGETIRVDP